MPPIRVFPRIFNAPTGPPDGTGPRRYGIGSMEVWPGGKARHGREVSLPSDTFVPAGLSLRYSALARELILGKFRVTATHGTAGRYRCQVTRLRAQICARIRKVTSKNPNFFLSASQALAEPLAV